MLLGKRQRPPIKRTTSLSEIIFDVNPEQSDQHTIPSINGPQGQTSATVDHHLQRHGSGDQRLSTRSSHRRHSADYGETPQFLRACALCKRRLVPGRDIYMYRGDSAFCSLECRQQQMAQDERKEKCHVASKKEATAAGSGGGETVAAL